MAHFYGKLQGQRGLATRLGGKLSGLETIAASWQGAIKVSLWYDDKKQVDMATVSMIPWNGQGTSKIIYQGPVSGLGALEGEQG